MRANLPMDRMATILAPTATIDASGGQVITYATLISSWCSREPKQAAEVRVGGALRDRTRFVFWFRYTPSISGVTGAHRISSGGVTYEVTDPPLEVSRNHLVGIGATEIV